MPSSWHLGKDLVFLEKELESNHEPRAPEEGTIHSTTPHLTPDIVM